MVLSSGTAVQCSSNSKVDVDVLGWGYHLEFDQDYGRCHVHTNYVYVGAYTAELHGKRQQENDKSVESFFE